MKVYILLICCCCVLVFPRWAAAYGFTCGCITYDWSQNVNRVSVCKVYATQEERDAGLQADRSEWSYHCEGTGSTSEGDFRACADYVANGEYNVGVYAFCPDPCAAKRAELEETCGEPGYILDEETCEGECVDCPDSDDDGVEDACDFCPQDPSYGRKKIKKYKVPSNTICGTYLYAGESCGYSELKCQWSSDDSNGDGLPDNEEFHPISPDFITAREMYRCCKSTTEEEECVVDENCDAVRGEGVCDCPDGSTDCDGCPDGGCICPDTDDDGQPNNPCEKCQVPGCVCSDTDGDGQPNTPCLECQEDDSQPTDTDGDGLPDNKDPCPNNPNPNCQPGDDTDGDGKDDNEDPCPNNPNPNCEPGDDDGDKIPDDKDPCPGNPDPDCTTTCLTTLDKFKAWTTTAESFPFNWMAAVKNMFEPLTSVNPSLPDSIGSMKVRLTVTEYGQSADLDFGSGYTVLRNSAVVSALAPAVALLRWAMGITIIFYMLPYFVARWHNIHGVSR